MTVAIILAGVATASFFSIIWCSFRNGISPTPSSPRVTRALLASLPASIDGPIFELGAGWGTLAFALAKRYPHTPIYAFESSPIPFLFMTIEQKLHRHPKLYLQKRDFFNSSLKEASLIVCYLYPGAMQRLSIKFREELKPGTIIATHTFRLPGWQPFHIIDSQDLYHTLIYLYRYDPD